VKPVTGVQRKKLRGLLPRRAGKKKRTTLSTQWKEEMKRSTGGAVKRFPKAKRERTRELQVHDRRRTQTSSLEPYKEERKTRS